MQIKSKEMTYDGTRKAENSTEHTINNDERTTHFA